MKKMLLLLVFVAASCRQQPIETQDLAGYWEIEQVLAPGKEKKEYKINETFDHFTVRGNSGSRSKVQPQFDGTFLVNDQPEHFTVESNSGKTFLNYTTKFATWKEEIVKLEDSTLVIKNSDNIEFHYKKTGPINFIGDGKTTK